MSTSSTNTDNILTCSVDWSCVRDRLLREMRLIPYNGDLRKLFVAIDAMISNLSKAEVDARRTGDRTHVSRQLITINESIRRIEKLMVLQMLRT